MTKIENRKLADLQYNIEYTDTTIQNVNALIDFMRGVGVPGEEGQECTLEISFNENTCMFDLSMSVAQIDYKSNIFVDFFHLLLAGYTSMLAGDGGLDPGVLEAIRLEIGKARAFLDGKQSEPT